MPRKKIAVITARADFNEQKDILIGIAKAAFALGADVNVFSNIYNYWYEDELKNFENVIYDLFDPYEYSGVIITSEAFRDLSIIDGVVEKIKASGIPAVAIEGNIPGIETIYPDDEGDIEKVTEHFITVHGFKDLCFISGFEDNPVSHKRVQGYKNALIKHGIPVDESKIHYSNFWNNGGAEIAQRYVDNELPMPQAFICANDFMAYGVCNTLIESGIRIPEDVSVIGYDYNQERIYNYPLLTTYRRGRSEIGIKAVNILLNGNYQEAEKDRFVFGSTCSCGIDHKQWREETQRINMALIKDTIITNEARLTKRLTLCKTLNEYFSTLANNYNLVYEANSMSICIDKDWNNDRQFGREYIYFKMTANEFGVSQKLLRHDNLLSFTDGNCRSPHISYYLPFVFQKKNLGVVTIEYNYPCCYDASLRDFISAAETTLEFLGMKNDIIYLNQCRINSMLDRSLADFGTFDELRYKVNSGSGSSEKTLLAIKLDFPESDDLRSSENERAEMISATVNAIKKIASKHEICSYSDSTFLIACQNEFIADKIEAAVHCEVVCKFPQQVAIEFLIDKNDSDGRVDTIIEEVNEKSEISKKLREEAEKAPHYSKLLELRNELVAEHYADTNIGKASRKLCISEGHFRRIYKECFGTTYVNDNIQAKIAYAKYLLCTTSMSVYSVAMKCGYSDEKYFTRQFKQSVGCSPVQYRRS